MLRITLIAAAMALGIGGAFAQGGNAPLPNKPTPIRDKWKIDPAHADMSAPKRTISTYVKRQELPMYFGNPNPEFEEVRQYPDLSSGVERATYNEDNVLFGNDDATHVTRWTGLPQHSNWRPPDCDAAVNGWVVQVTNVRWAIYDKCGNQVFLETFATTTGLSTFLFDPKVIFDPWSQRFFMLIHSKNEAASDSDLVILVSDDSNPNGNWDIYSFDTDTSTGGAAWSDYYDVAAGPTALYLAGNQFTYASDSFTGAQMIIMDKADMIAGLATANSWESFPLTNSDGTTTTSPRPCEMMWDPGSTDMILVSNQWGGGDYVYLNRISDPYGTRTQTKNRVDVGAYTNPPAAVQPGGDTLVDFNARVMNAVFSADTTNSNQHHLWLAFMAGRNSNADVGCRVINIRTSDHVPICNSNFGAADWDYIFPAVQPNYRGEAAVTFSRTQNVAGSFCENRYSTIEKVTATDYDFAGSTLIQDGTGSYTQDNRWGDYFGHSLDWGDYNYASVSGSGGLHKIWMYGQYAISASSYGTSMGATVIDAAQGVMAVDSDNTIRRVDQGNATGQTWQFTLSNAGGVSYWWEVSSKPTWVNVSVDNSEVFRGDTDIITFTTNTGANSLAFGKHVGNITFRNCFNGATAVRTINLHVGDFHYVENMNVVEGELFSGVVGDLQTNNNVRVEYFNDPTSLTSEIWLDMTQGYDDIYSIYGYVESRIARPGVAERIYMWDWTSTQWDFFAGRNLPTNDSYWIPISNYTADPDRYTSTAGKMYISIVHQPINDEDPSQDGWLSGLDRCYWYIYP